MFPLAIIWARSVQKNAAASGVALDALELADSNCALIHASTQKKETQCDL